MEDRARDKLLNAAGEAFAEHGLEKATVRDICRRAGLRSGVNYYFSSKEQLYAEVLKYAHRFKSEQVPLPERPAGMPPEARLRDFVRTMVTRLLVAQELPWQARLMLREMMQPTGACRELVEDYVRPLHRELCGIVAEMAPRGTPPHVVHQLTFGVMGQCLFYKFHRPVVDMLLGSAELDEHFTPERLADRITDLTLAALGRRPLFPDAAPPKEKGQRNKATVGGAGPPA